MALWLVVIVFFIACLSVYFSAWLPWYLLPASKSMALAVDYTAPHSQELYRATFSRSTYTQELSRLSSARYAAYSFDESGQTLVVIPPLTAYSGLGKQLEKQGWIVEYIGLILRARKTTTASNSQSEAALPSLTTAIGKTLQHFLSRPDQAFPLSIAVVKQGAIPEADHTYYLLAFSRRGGIVGVVQSGEISGDVKTPIMVNASHNAKLQVSLPSDILSYIPESQLNLWQPKLESSFDFIKTHPSFVNELKRHTMFTVMMSDRAASLGVVGQPQLFTDAVSQWLSQEDAYYRPRKQAFRLPDGGLGYEVVPGKSRTVLSPIDENGCREYVGEGQKSWLCLNGDAAILGTNKSDALRLVKAPTPNYYMAINGSTKELLGINDLVSFIIEGKDLELAFTLHFKN